MDKKQKEICEILKITAEPLQTSSAYSRRTEIGKKEKEKKFTHIKKTGTRRREEKKKESRES